MPDDEPGSPPGTDSGARRQRREGDDSIPVVIDVTSDDGHGDLGGPADVGLDPGDRPDMATHGSNPIDFRDDFGGEHERPVGDADEHGHGFGVASENHGALGVDLSPWAPLLDMLDATEPEASPGDRPFTPTEGVGGPHALELRAESMLQYSERGARRTGALDRTEVGDSDDNRDIVAGRDAVEVDGMLDEHTGHGLVVVADELEMNVGGPLTMHAHLEDNIIMAGVMRDEFAGGTLVTAAMSDDMAAGLGLRCTAPLDVWVHGLVGMEERPGTCAADGLLFELAGTLYEREYGPSMHVAAVARLQGATVTTMKTGFRPLMKTALGVRNLIPGGGGGGGQASASPPAAPPAPSAGEADAATLTAVEGGESLGRGVAGGDDTDEVASVVRTAETASDTAEVEDLQHPASTADDLDDLARVDVEGEGYQQIAEIYDQPVPAADETSGAGAATPGSTRSDPPSLYSTDPGSEGYRFDDAYGSLHDRNQFYRRELNMRGNLFTREYLSELDAQAIELLAGVGGNVDEVAIDNYGLRTSSVYTTLQEMAQEAEAAGDLDSLADIRAAMDQLEGLVQDTLAQFAARTDEFQGTALGSQHLLDPNIDAEKLRSWLQEQFELTEQAMMDPQTSFEDMQRLSWTRDYYDQMLVALDAGIDPLAESGEQIAFLFSKTDGQIQADVFLELQDGLMSTLSDPEFFRSADEMGLDAFTPPVRDRIVAGEEFLGPDSLRPLAEGLDEPDVTPVLAADEPPPPLPDQSAADAPPGGSPAAEGAAPPEPPLYRTEPGTDGYDFQDAYGSLGQRNQYYREHFNFRGNFFMREYLAEIDARALELFESLGDTSGAIAADSFGHETPSIYRTLQEMAQEADSAGDVNRAADIRAVMAEIEDIVNGTLAEVALRVDEFSGAPIDSAIDTAKLRSWLQDQASNAQQAMLAAQTDEARQLASWEWGYYLMLVQTLDAGGNPLAVSNEQIAVLRINNVDSYYAQFPDDVVAAIAAGDPSAPPPAPGAVEVDLYVTLQGRLEATLSDPEFFRSAEELGGDAFAPAVRSRIEAGRDFLGSGPVRRSPEREAPPSLSAVDPSGGATYIDDVRDVSFSRSALAASEETLQRQAAGLADGDGAVGNRAPDPGSGIPEPSFGLRRTPPDEAQAPVIDHRSGQWAPEPFVELDAAPAPAGDVFTPERGDRVKSQASDVSWESGLQVSGDAALEPVATNAGDSDSSDLFRPVPEPEDVEPVGVDEPRHATTANGDGDSGSLTTSPDGTKGDDANPTVAVAEPGEFTISGAGEGAEPRPADTAPPIAPGIAEPVPAGAAGNASGTDATLAGASAMDVDAGATGTRADLFGEPASLEGRSLERTPRADDPRELARALDRAELPVEDLAPAGPDPGELARKSILEDSDGGPVPDSYRDADDTLIRIRREWAEHDRIRRNRGGATADSVWSGDRGRWTAIPDANARWSEFAAAGRTSSATFGDDPRQLLYRVESDHTVFSGRRGTFVDRLRGADPPNTIDRAHASRYVPGPRCRVATRVTGFGRLSQAWNELPFSPRERIVNALHRGEALSPDQIISLELGLESYRAAGGELSSSQYRAMVDMIADLGEPYRHTRWSVHGEGGERLLQLIEMLDHVGVTD